MSSTSRCQVRGVACISSKKLRDIWPFELRYELRGASPFEFALAKLVVMDVPETPCDRETFVRDSREVAGEAPSDM